MRENIARAAGAVHGQALEPSGFAEIVQGLGRPLVQRSTRYRPMDIGGVQETTPAERSSAISSDR